MKLILHLTNLDYIYDFNQMGINDYIVTGEYGTYSPIVYSLDDIEIIQKQVKHLYVNINALYDEHELEDVFHYIDKLNELSVYGIIFHDFGIFHYVQEKKYNFKMIYAPQTLNTNSMTLNVYKDLGINYALVSKELPLHEQVSIQENSKMPLVYHAHGVNYMASSKRPLLTNYEKMAKVQLKGDIKIQPRNQDFKCHIYEDKRGVTIYSETKFYSLDLFNHIKNFEYLYIETLYMTIMEMIEVVSLYTDAIKYYEEGQYNQQISSLMNLLRQVSTPLDRYFDEGATLYHLDDIKRRDNGEF